MYHILLVILFNWRRHSHKQTYLLKQLYDLFNIIQNTTLNVLLKAGIKSTPLNLQKATPKDCAFCFHRGTKGARQKVPQTEALQNHCPNCTQSWYRGRVKYLSWTLLNNHHGNHKISQASKVSCLACSDKEWGVKNGHKVLCKISAKKDGFKTRNWKSYYYYYYYHQEISSLLMILDNLQYTAVVIYS